MKKWTLVTGGAGYMGSIVVDELLARGAPRACRGLASARQCAVADAGVGPRRFRVPSRRRSRPLVHGLRAPDDVQTASSTWPRSSAIRPARASREFAKEVNEEPRARCSTTRGRPASSGSSSPRRARTTASSPATTTPRRTLTLRAGLALRRDEGRGRARRARRGERYARADLRAARDRLWHVTTYALRPNGQRIRAGCCARQGARRVWRAVLAAVCACPRRGACGGHSARHTAQTSFSGKSSTSATQTRTTARSTSLASCASAFQTPGSNSSTEARIRATIASASRKSEPSSASASSAVSRMGSTRSSGCSGAACSETRMPRSTATRQIKGVSRPRWRFRQQLCQHGGGGRPAARTR